MTTIHFIINPIAGKGHIPYDLKNIHQFFDAEDHIVDVKTTQYPGHATLLAQQSVRQGANIIVACGGDGTINEVASCLVHTKIALGIIPIGSGNGLASSLKIPRKISKAIEVIKNMSVQKIDVATVNGKPFLSNMGIGFDAKVISNFNNSGERNFKAYFKAVLKAIKNYRNTSTVKVEINGSMMETAPFMLFVSNSNVMGYDMSLTRMASMQDGWLDVVVIDAISKGEMLVLGLLLLLRATNFFRKIKYFKTKELRIEFDGMQKGYLMQTDGELHNISGLEVMVGVEENGLRVIAP